MFKSRREFLKLVGIGPNPLTTVDCRFPMRNESIPDDEMPNRKAAQQRRSKDTTRERFMVSFLWIGGLESTILFRVGFFWRLLVNNHDNALRSFDCALVVSSLHYVGWNEVFCDAITVAVLHDVEKSTREK